MTDDPAGTYYDAQTATVAVVAAEMARRWAAFDVAQVDASWPLVRDGVARAVAAGQIRAAALPAQVIARTLTIAGLSPLAGTAVLPVAFAGFTSAGFPLAVALDVAPILVKLAVARGVVPDLASAVGLRALNMVASTEIGDASRDAMGAGMRLEPQVTGWTRRTERGACDRCTVQAGKHFRHNQGFQRHPHCHCVHSPTTETRKWSPTVRGPGMAVSGTPYSRVNAPARMSVLRIAQQSGSDTEYRDLLVANGYAA